MRNFIRLLAPALIVLTLTACFRNYQLSEADTSDPGIKARIEAQLRAQKGLDLRYVIVDVYSRVVTVSGQVLNYEDKSTITRIVNSVPGPEQVMINLIVHD